MSIPPIVAPKKLIEVALPLDDINRAAAREKSIRHGHPSTLHLWWARRPLAAARAVLFAQLVNDPSWKYTEEELAKNQIKGAITKKRNELFKLLSQLVQWENTTNEEILERARKEIRASWKETCEANKNHPDAKTLFDPNRLPAFHDPFAGGGAIPLEAQRLGLESYASDLNPVAVLINKALIEIPPRFAGRPPIGPVPKEESQTSAQAAEDWSGARGLAEDVRRYGTWMRDEAEKRVGHLYPKIKITGEIARGRPDLKALVGETLPVIAWLWARTVKSPNPAFASIDVPLASTFLLYTKAGHEVWLDPHVTKSCYDFTIRCGTPPVAAENGTKLARGANFRCLMSGAAIAPDYVKSEARAGRLGTRMLAMVVGAESGRVYVSPTPEMEAAARNAKPTWKPSGKLVEDARAFTPYLYGLTSWSDLFTDRQLVFMDTISQLVSEVRTKVEKEGQRSHGGDATRFDEGGSGAAAYADAIAIYLSFAISKVANIGSTLASWMSDRGAFRETFARQALAMVWDFAEANPFADAGGSLGTALEKGAMAIVACPAVGRGYATQQDAQTQSISLGKVISTDPPYYDNIPYADLSDFFYVWLRRALRPVLPQLFGTIEVPKSEELVATSYRHGGKEKAEAFFLEGMTRALERLRGEAHLWAPVTIYYAFKQSDTDLDGTSSSGWETFLRAVMAAGFAIVGTWPVRTEGSGRLRGAGSNALASSIVLVCRPRAKDAVTVTRKDFLRRLERVLPDALRVMTADPEASIAPVDLAQAAIGPGMAVYSMYEAVLEADGAPMSVHSALVYINKAVDDYFAHAEGDLDADTRFCIGWFQQRGFESGPFGEADVLARAKGTAVDRVEESGVVSASKGKVRLFRIKDYPKVWDPAKDIRLSIWEACHHMCRALGESEHEAGVLLARMPDKQDAIRQLAYRLYTICERQKWAEDAGPYNELVKSWPAIVGESNKVGHTGTQLELV